MADEMGCDKTCTSMSVAMICKLLTRKDILDLLLSIVWRNTVDEMVNMVQKENPGIISEDLEGYPLER